MTVTQMRAMAHREPGGRLDAAVAGGRGRRLERPGRRARDGSERLTERRLAEAGRPRSPAADVGKLDAAWLAQSAQHNEAQARRLLW